MTYPVYEVYNTLIPGGKEKPKVLRYTLDAQTWDPDIVESFPIIDLTLEVEQKKICFIQGCYIDNLSNWIMNGSEPYEQSRNHFVLENLTTRQRIAIGIATAGYYPMFAPNNPIWRLRCADPAIGEIENAINFHFYNMPVWPYVWQGPVTD